MIECDLLITDQEIRGSKETGIEVIARTGLKQKAILSSSYFFSPEIQDKVEKLECNLLPKFLIDHFQLTFLDKSPPTINPDLVLIDDDLMCRKTWQLVAEANHKRVEAFESYDEFSKTKISKSIPIYVDKNLSGGDSGYVVLKQLHKMGYKNLHLTTGEFRQEKNAPKYIASVVSKEFPLTA